MAQQQAKPSTSKDRPAPEVAQAMEDTEDAGPMLVSKLEVN